ncbi:MAG: flagellar protein FlaG [Treponema sp.]|jgi:flagellar protein FlaG|nr:flagellar protein FlaG [Treponema sp.]
MSIIVASVGNRMGGVNADHVPEPLRPRNVRAAEVAVASGKVAAGQNRKIQDITRDLEQISLSFNKKLQFVVDHQSNEITVKVIDRATDKVIKVLPPEELQRLHSKIEETIGFLFDEKV